MLLIQDGSCNGLQHYAALGRDYVGGKMVKCYCCLEMVNKLLPCY